MIAFWTAQSIAIKIAIVIGIIILLYIILNIILALIEVHLQKKYINLMQQINYARLHDGKEHAIILEPCPYCGGHTADLAEEYEIDLDGEKHKVGFSVMCDPESGGCGARTSVFDTPEDAISMWNLRNGKIKEFWN